MPSTMRGHTLADLAKLAAAPRLRTGRHSGRCFGTVPAAASGHSAHWGQEPRRGWHYWVLDKVQGNRVELFDPQSGHRFSQTVGELAKEWAGNALVFLRGGALRRRRLSLQENGNLLGGLLRRPRPPDNNGDPNRNGGPPPPNQCHLGSPSWQVNVVNMNLFVTDTPIWYDPPIGPSVRHQTSATTRSPPLPTTSRLGISGCSTTAANLAVDTSGSVLIYMPDGRYDVFSPGRHGRLPQTIPGLQHPDTHRRELL